MPTDPSARLFELLVLLETHWQFNRLGTHFPLCLISRTGKEAVGFVRSLTEWMGGQIASEGADKLRFRSELNFHWMYFRRPQDVADHSG